MPGVLSIARNDIEVDTSPIGHGGSSTVYTGRYKSSPVAVKRQNRPDKNELNILSKLKHPHVVALIGVVDQRPDFFLILELCEGGSLRDYLDTKTNLPVHEVLCFAWAEQAARAIEYLQEIVTVIHRDIKSNNFLITDLQTKHLKLCDFGISKTSAKTVTTEVKGTWGWTAPEVFKEERISPKSDIFSYATVLWEMLTGKIPFRGIIYPTIMFKICNLKERPPIPPNCPKEVSTLLHQCWKDDRYERPDIGEVLQIVINLRIQAQAKYRNAGVDLQSVLPYIAIETDIDGSKASLKVCHGTTIDGIKGLIQQTNGMQPAQLKVFHKDQELDDRLTLSDCRIHSGSTLTFKHVFTIFISYGNGEIIQHQVRPGQTTADIKQIIQQKTGIPCTQQHLIPRDTLLKIGAKFTKPRYSAEQLDRERFVQEIISAELNDQHTWSAINIQSGDTLRLVDFESVFELHEVRGWYPHKTYLVTSCLTIDDLKSIFGLVAYQFPLYFRGQCLEEDKTLQNYGIMDQASIEYRYW